MLLKTKNPYVRAIQFIGGDDNIKEISRWLFGTGYKFEVRDSDDPLNKCYFLIDPAGYETKMNLGDYIHNSCNFSKEWDSLPVYYVSNSYSMNSEFRFVDVTDMNSDEIKSRMKYAFVSIMSSQESEFSNISHIEFINSIDVVTKPRFFTRYDDGHNRVHAKAVVTSKKYSDILYIIESDDEFRYFEIRDDNKHKWTNRPKEA